MMEGTDILGPSLINRVGYSVVYESWEPSQKSIPILVMKP